MELLYGLICTIANYFISSLGIHGITNNMTYCKHLMSYCKYITERGTRSAWFAKCVGCNTRWIYSSDMYECTECQVFVHKCCWIFGQCCVLEASDKRSATGVEVSEDAEPPGARNRVEVCEVSTETTAYLVDSSMQTDVLDQLHVSTQTETKVHHHSSSADESVVPLGDDPMYGIFDRKPVVPSIGTIDEELSSFPTSGSGTADTVVRSDLPKAVCASCLSTEFTGVKMLLTPKQRIRKIRVEKETALKVKSDAVSALQELCSARGWQTPVYHSWTETILNRFQVDCSVYGNTVKGEGGSKKEAKYQAAYKAYMTVTNLN